MTNQATPSGATRQTLLDAAQATMAGKGFSAVGLNEILNAAGVPKGSFYHYFASKEAFGQALLARYFDTSLATLDAMLAPDAASVGERLMRYWQHWADSQMAAGPHAKCLVVKLGAEVADLSAAMRRTLHDGTARLIARLAAAIEAGVADGSLATVHDPAEAARTLYQTWLGASVMAKISGGRAPFDNAAAVTRQMLRPVATHEHRQHA
ncbi:TetR/AcrR family transcriptional regulator [Burkholderia sp. 22PA0099]|uniref:TetR/AcrR family transcriptional regulator n=1 Tax=Burkholderia sp. 22PA0099 TaxID=3237372 RepID=UPI0039C0B50E